MSKYITLQINEPCHQNWDLMTKQEQGRFCDMCNKHVVDFTMMTNAQVANYFILHRKENTCGRFHEDQLNQAIAIPSKEIPWLKYFFTITLPAFLFAAKSYGQKKIEPVKTTLSPSKNINDKVDQMKVDTLEEVIVYSNTGCIKRSFVMGGAASVISKKISTSNTTNKTLEKKIIEEEKINIYPNPVPSNSTLNLSFTNNLIGEIVVEIFTANGELIKKENRKIISKTNHLEISTANMIAGYYICMATNKKTNEKFSKVFIVK